jgi:predicted small metal-binding protein
MNITEKLYDQGVELDTETTFKELSNIRAIAQELQEALDIILEHIKLEHGNVKIQSSDTLATIIFKLKEKQGITR